MTTKDFSIFILDTQLAAGRFIENNKYEDCEVLELLNKCIYNFLYLLIHKP